MTDETRAEITPEETTITVHEAKTEAEVEDATRGGIREIEIGRIILIDQEETQEETRIDESQIGMKVMEVEIGRDRRKASEASSSRTSAATS